MSELMEYKGFFGSVRYSAQDEVFHGRLEFIQDLVTFEGSTAKGLKKAFREAVEDYLALCALQKRPPDAPLKGSFNLRTGQELHRRAMLYAQRHDLSLNAVVTEALKKYLDSSDRAA
jgi:predicted HicB family RNase H-like nuclease